MSIIAKTKGDKAGIWAEILSSQSGGTGEYNSECRVYMGKRVIGYLSEDETYQLCIRGLFDYKETGEYDVVGVEDVPRIVDNALYLCVGDLRKLIEIIEHWESEGEEHKDMWEEV